MYLHDECIAAQRITLFVEKPRVIAARQKDQGLAAGMAAGAVPSNFPPAQALLPNYGQNCQAGSAVDEITAHPLSAHGHDQLLAPPYNV